MTVAQLVLLADVHWPSASATPTTVERGTADDLFALARMQK